MALTLIRHAYLEECTLGRLTAGDLTLATLEEPWIENTAGPGGQRRGANKRESCVPDGAYKLRPHDGTRFKGVWALENPDLGVYYRASQMPEPQAWGRSAILLHSGNTVLDIEGCLLVGLYHSRLDGREAVLQSRLAVEHLRTVLGRERHELIIRPTLGTAEAA